MCVCLVCVYVWCVVYVCVGCVYVCGCVYVVDVCGGRRGYIKGELFDSVFFCLLPFPINLFGYLHR